MGIPSIVIDRARRLIEHPDLTELGITKMEGERDTTNAQMHLVLHCRKGLVILSIDEASPSAEGTVRAVVLGIPQDAPNPARKNQTPFIKWLAKHPQLVDAPIDPTAMARDAWLERYGEVPQCYLCGHPMRWVTPRAGGDGFWGCAQFQTTSCKGSLNVDADYMVQPRCPDCGKPMRERDGSKGRFWGCTGYRDGCRRTLDGTVGDGLRTEVDDWLPSRGKGGMPATAARLRGGPVGHPAKARSEPSPGPTPGEPAEDAQSEQEGGRGTSLAALRRRFQS